MHIIGGQINTLGCCIGMYQGRFMYLLDIVDVTGRDINECSRALNNLNYLSRQLVMSLSGLFYFVEGQRKCSKYDKRTEFGELKWKERKEQSPLISG